MKVKNKIVVRFFDIFKSVILQFFYVFRLRSMPLPRVITLTITHNCNLKCSMCARNTLSLQRQNLSVEKFASIVDKLPKLKDISIIGLGEPLVNPDFFRILETAKLRGIGIYFSTNGTLLTEESIRKLTENVFYVSFSIDSPDAEKYNEIRKGAQFDKVIENLKILQKIRPDILVAIEPIMMKENIEDLPKFVELAKELKVEFLTYVHIFSLDLEQDKKHISNFKESGFFMDEAKKLSKKLGVTLWTRPLYPVLKPCVEPWVKPDITMDGDVYPCCFMYRVPGEKYPEWYMGQSLEVPSSNYKMGNIFEEPFDKIWNGPAYKTLRKTILDSNKKEVLSIEEFNKRRRSIDSNKRFSYCEICLYRWSVAC